MSTLAALVTRLVAQGGGTAAVDLFYGSRAALPDGPGPFTTLRATDGLPPVGTHNAGLTVYRRPTVQVVVRGEDYIAVETRATAVYAALTFTNTTVGGVRFLKCVPLQEPVDLGLDGNGRVQIGFNVAIERQG